MKRRIIAIISIIGVCVSLSACAKEETPTPSVENSVTTSASTMSELTEPSEHGTSAYVDYICYKAKTDAEDATDEELQAALDWLKENVENIFSSQENMELTMYNGELLEYRYKKTGNDFEKIGWQAFKTVKYVYRGAETKSDQATVDNYAKLKELLSAADDIA